MLLVRLFLFFDNTRTFIERKRKRSDSVLWQKPLYQQKCEKRQHDNTKTSPKSSITQRLRTDLGRSDGVATVIQPVWLTSLRAKPLRKIKNKLTYEVLCSIRGSYSAIWSLPLTNVKFHSDHWPTVTSWCIHHSRSIYFEFPTDQTFHQFQDLETELDLQRIMSGFHVAFATGVVCQQGSLTLPDAWFRPPFWD